MVSLTRRNLSVVHLVPALHVGGMEQVVRALTTRTIQQSPVQTVEIVCLFELGELGQQLRAEGVPIRCLAASRSITGRIGQLRRSLTRTSDTILHCHNLQAFTYGAAAFAGRRLRDVVLTKHGTRMPHRKSLGEWYRRFASRQASLVGVSAEIQSLLAEWSGTRLDHVRLIPNGIVEPASSFNREASRRDLAITDDDLVVICAARLSAEKDHRTLLHAFAKFHAVVASSTLLLVGDGPLRDELRALSRELNIAESVRFLGQRMDVERCLSASDIAVLTSTTEGTPLFLLEAMAANVPIVATRVGGIPQLIEDRRQGILIDPLSVEQTTQALLALAANSEWAMEMGRRGSERVRACYSFERTFESYQSLYRERAGVAS